jgi:Family of unknown function (DUF6499)
MTMGHGNGTAWTASLDDYAYLRNANRVSWAWEFLRRNPAYQKDYEAIRPTLLHKTRHKDGVIVIDARRSFWRAEAWGLVLFRRSGGGA